MSPVSEWSLIINVTNILGFITWAFPLISLAILSYCIEHYTRFRTKWALYIIATLLAVAYPVLTAFDYWEHGNTIVENQIIATTLLLTGLVIAAYASLQLMNFQKIQLGRTKQTIQLLVFIGILAPLASTIAGKTTHAEFLHLTAYNLSVTSLILIFLAIGKLTQNYIPRQQMLAYTSARIGSILLLADPFLRNYVYIKGVELSMKYSLRFMGILIQLFATVLLSITVVMLILEAQARGVHLIPSDERSERNKPMKYRLKRGYSYLIQEESPSHSTDIFADYVTHNHHGLLITRAQPSRIRQDYRLNTTPILWMTNSKTDEKTVKPRDIDRIVYIIKDFIKFDTDSIILIQRLDYLITENDFNTVLRMIHDLNDIIMSSKCILMVSLDSGTLSREEVALLLQELEDLTNVEKVTLGEPLYSVLLFVYSENTRRRTPSFKSVTRKFEITKTTARKRIYDLEDKGLLRILNQGRYKFLEVTEKGRALVRSPASSRGGENG
ncbi:MAG: DUF835 domain-containing protein [Candidatus Altiarchaeales archaeon]|nr:DUF835 domain-containing protein [Candidatus Altiarchaeales archaeon]MBD3415874.1 DUF835 domain-containing protein [Candidatus Altiarchaeales archaeon]